jgi:hypothetical protein
VTLAPDLSRRPATLRLATIAGTVVNSNVSKLVSRQVSTVSAVGQRHLVRRESRPVQPERLQSNGLCQHSNRTGLHMVRAFTDPSCAVPAQCLAAQAVTVEVGCLRFHAGHARSGSDSDAGSAERNRWHLVDIALRLAHFRERTEAMSGM